MTRIFWQIAHHTVAHPLIGLSLGRLWAWWFHDWTGRRAWPEPGDYATPQRWAGLE
jgi:hypothetical protein